MMGVKGLRRVKKKTHTAGEADRRVDETAPQGWTRPSTQECLQQLVQNPTRVDKTVLGSTDPATAINLER